MKPDIIAEGNKFKVFLYGKWNEFDSYLQAAIWFTNEMNWLFSEIQDNYENWRIL